MPGRGAIPTAWLVPGRGHEGPANAERTGRKRGRRGKAEAHLGTGVIRVIVCHGNDPSLLVSVSKTGLSGLSLCLAIFLGTGTLQRAPWLLDRSAPIDRGERRLETFSIDARKPRGLAFHGVDASSTASDLRQRLSPELRQTIAMRARLGGQSGLVSRVSGLGRYLGLDDEPAGSRGEGVDVSVDEERATKD